MLKSKTLAIGVVLVIMVLTVLGQQKTEVDVRFPERLDKATKGVIPNATIQEDLITDQLRRIRGKVDVSGAINEKDAADKFVLLNEALLLRSKTTTQDQLKTLTDINELRPVKEVTSLSGKVIIYERIYQGLPVFDDQLMILVDKANKITALNADLSPISETAALTLPQDSSAAVVAAIDAVGAKGEAIDTQVQQGVVVARTSSKVTPLGAWKVTFKTRSPAAAWRVLVEGGTNKILSKNNVAQYAEGTGMVFAPNPIQASGDNTLTDSIGGSDDADDPKLTNARTQVTLHDLDENTGFLQGKYATIVTASRANELSRVYDFTRSNPHFEEVMAYYWITENQRYIQSLGFTNVNNRSVNIDVHFTKDDNSFYDPETKMLQFGDGGVDDAEDGEVILHELGHAIQDNQVPGFGGNITNTEARAMGEGFGDYWSASFFAGMGPRLDLWNSFWDKWDGLSFNKAKGTDPPFLRKLDSNKHYPEDWIGREHVDGEMWSACLWKLRERLGRRRADTIILESHFRLNGVTRTFAEGAKAIIAVHEALEKGRPGFDADRDAIKKVFTDRGILK